MDFTAVIPARAGSKGIANKNKTDFLGKPLIAHTIQAALDSHRFDQILVSTDDKEILSLARSLGVEGPRLRPAHLANDEALIVDVLKDLLVDCRNDHLVLLQATSPLRTAKQIQQALTLYQTRRPASLVSVQVVPHQFNPGSIMTLDEDHVLAPYLENADTNPRRQSKTKFYARNGPAILITQRELIESGNLYGEPNLAFEMDAMSSIDIDSAEDLELATIYCRSR